MGARLLGADRAPILGRRHAHHAEEGRERDGHAAADRDMAGAGLGVRRDVQHALVGEVLRQGAEERPEGAEAPVGAELDLLDVDAQAVARLGALHRDRPGQDVRAKPRRVGGMDGGEFFRNFQAGAGRRHHIGRTRDAFEDDEVAGIDGLHRREGGVEGAPADVLERGRDVVGGRHGGPPERSLGNATQAGGWQGACRVRARARLSPPQLLAPAPHRSSPAAGRAASSR